MLEDQMLVYINQSINEDVKVIKELKKVFYDLTEVYNEMGAFIEELETLKCSSNVIRSAILLNKIQRLSVEKVTHLLIMRLCGGKLVFGFSG
nr:hypothetical protein [Tanacetum cinerariifolium]